MLRRVASGTMRLVRGMALFGGAAVTLALILGVGTVALAAVPGDPFKLGKNNVVNNALTALIGSRAGGAMLLVDNNSDAQGSRALDLRVQPGKAPLTVNADAGKAGGLNADKVDGKSANQIGINGLERVGAESTINSDSQKGAAAVCPAGKVLLEHGFFVSEFPLGTFPNQLTDVTVHEVFITEKLVNVKAIEEEPTSKNWSVSVTATCAIVP